jgi:hypothetical protein
VKIKWQKVQHSFGEDFELLRALVPIKRAQGVTQQLVQLTRTPGEMWRVVIGGEVVSSAPDIKQAEWWLTQAAPHDLDPHYFLHPQVYVEKPLPLDNRHDRSMRLAHYLRELGMEPVSIYRDEDDKLVALMKPVGM